MRKPRIRIWVQEEPPHETILRSICVTGGFLLFCFAMIALWQSGPLGGAIAALILYRLLKP